MEGMAKSNPKRSVAIGFTIFNIIFFFPVLLIARFLPLGMGSETFKEFDLYFLYLTWLSPLAVPFAIYKGWKSIHNPSWKLFIFYHLFPLIYISIIFIYVSLCWFWPE
jgi:hypothetical protein